MVYIAERLEKASDDRYYEELFGEGFSRLLGDPVYRTVLVLAREFVPLRCAMNPEDAIEALRSHSDKELRAMISSMGGELEESGIGPEAEKALPKIGKRLGTEIVPLRTVTVRYPGRRMSFTVCDNDASLVHASLVDPEEPNILSAEERVLPEAVLLGLDTSVRRLMSEYSPIRRTVGFLNDDFALGDIPDADDLAGTYCLRKRRYAAAAVFADLVRDRTAWYSAEEYDEVEWADGEPEPLFDEPMSDGSDSPLAARFRSVDYQVPLPADREEDMAEGLAYLLEEKLIPDILGDIDLVITETRRDPEGNRIFLSASDPWSFVHDLMMVYDGGRFSGSPEFRPVMEAFAKEHGTGLTGPEVFAICFETYLGADLKHMRCVLSSRNAGMRYPDRLDLAELDEDTVNGIATAVMGGTPDFDEDYTMGDFLEETESRLIAQTELFEDMDPDVYGMEKDTLVKCMMFFMEFLEGGWRPAGN